MNTSDKDWNEWAGDWQQEPARDIERLQRRTHRKLLQMRFMLVFESIVALFALAQVIRLQFIPWVPVRWKVWAALMFFLVIAVACMSFRARRGTWRALTASAPDLLRLTVKRARSGIRLAWVNIVSIFVLLAVTLPIAAPWLAPSRWLHDPALRHVLLLQVGVNGPIIIGGIVFFAVYIRRQRRRLREAAELLKDYSDTGTDPSRPTVSGSS